MNIDSLFSHIDQKPESGILYIVGTPIGNLYDISLRALNTLKNVSLVACEDTRQTQKIMNKYSIKNNLISFNMHNSIKKIPIIINQLKKGESIALVSDAGMPSICDPGENLVREVKLNKLKTICIPGPCAALTALVSSGLESSKFIFEGFLPKKQSERNKILFDISKNAKTTIIYESPHRINKLLVELKNFCGGDREIQLYRELTKKFEEHIGNNINEVIDKTQDKEINYKLNRFDTIFGVILECFWCDFDTIFGSIWYDFGTMLASFWFDFVMLLLSFWDGFGLISIPFLNNCGMILV